MKNRFYKGAFYSGRFGEFNKEESTGQIFGFHIDPTKANASQAVSYLADAVGKTPAAMGNTFSYGDWADAFFMPKPCMLRYDGTVAYYLDPTDYTKKADGTASDVANASFAGNAMMEWPKIWYKFVQGTADGEGEFYCADHQVDSSYHCWCNYDADNNIIDHFYTAIYNGCVIDGKMRSLSGVQLSSNASNNTTNKSMSDDIAYAEANNSGTNKDWYINVFSDMSLITALTMMIFHRIDMNYIVTPGGLARDATYTTGTSDDRGLFYGIPDTASETKIFGMENYIGYMYRWVAGVGSNTDREIGLKYTRGSADGTGISDYDIYAHNYLVDTDELIPITSGHITKMWFRDGGIYPRETREPSSFDPADNDRYYSTGYAMPTDMSSYAVLVIRSGNEFNRYSPYEGYSIIGAALTCKPKGGYV